MKAVNAVLIALLVAQGPMAFAGKAGIATGVNQQKKANLSQAELEAQAKAARNGSVEIEGAQGASVTGRKALPAQTAPKAAARTTAVPVTPRAQISENTANDQLVSQNARELAANLRESGVTDEIVPVLETLGTNPGKLGVTGKAKAKIGAAIISINEAIKSAKRKMGSGTRMVLDRVAAMQLIEKTLALFGIKKNELVQNCKAA